MEENERNKTLFTPFDQSATKKSKEKSAVELRQSKRGELAQKRRNLDVDPSWISLNTHYPSTYSSEDLPMILQAFQLQDDTSYLFIAQAIRKLLCKENDCPLKEICESELMGHIPTWLSRNDHTQLQYEAGWICTNISSTMMCQILYRIGAIPPLVALLLSPNEDVRSISAWALGNISANTAEERDYLIELNVVDYLSTAVSKAYTSKSVANTIWAITNLCRKKPLPSYDAVSKVFPLIFKFVDIQDNKVVSDILWAFVVFVKQFEVQQVLMESHNLKMLFRLGRNTKSSMVQRLSMRIIGGLVYSSSILTQRLLEEGAAELICENLSMKNEKVRKEAVWALGNICAETPQQLEYVFRYGSFEKIIQMTELDGILVKTECVWVLCNACAVGSAEQIIKLIEFGLFKALLILLECRLETSTVLLGIQKILTKGAEHFVTATGVNLLALALDNSGILNILHDLVNDNDEKVSSKANSLLNSLENNSDEMQADVMQIVEDGFRF